MILGKRFILGRVTGNCVRSPVLPATIKKYSMNAVCRAVKKNAVLTLTQRKAGPGKRRASGEGNPSTGWRLLFGGCDAACSRACKIGKKGNEEN